MQAVVPVVDMQWELSVLLLTVPAILASTYLADSSRLQCSLDPLPTGYSFGGPSGPDDVVRNTIVKHLPGREVDSVRLPSISSFRPLDLPI